MKDFYESKLKDQETETQVRIQNLQESGSQSS